MPRPSPLWKASRHFCLLSLAHGNKFPSIAEWQQHKTYGLTKIRAGLGIDAMMLMSLLHPIAKMEHIQGGKGKLSSESAKFRVRWGFYMFLLAGKNCESLWEQVEICFESWLLKKKVRASWTTLHQWSMDVARCFRGFLLSLVQHQLVHSALWMFTCPTHQRLKPRKNSNKQLGNCGRWGSLPLPSTSGTWRKHREIWWRGWPGCLNLQGVQVGAWLAGPERRKQHGNMKHTWNTMHVKIFIIL